jgi:putative sigma-54 modulation protein
MTTVYDSNADSKLLIRGIRLGLDDTARAFIETKTERLFRHEPRILRLRIDVERDARSRTSRFTAKGRIEVAGPDLTASVTHTVALASITILIDKLDRMLRKRTNNLMRRRTTGDIRTHSSLVTSA